MNLYLLWQEVNNSYETYDSCVVCAENMDEAIRIHPANNPREEIRDELWESLVDEWADLENIHWEHYNWLGSFRLYENGKKMPKVWM